MKNLIKILDKPPLSGDYEEILFDLPGPWREPIWNYAIFRTSNGFEWCGVFRAKSSNNFLIAEFAKTNISCIVSGGHGYIIDINQKIKVADVITEPIRSIMADQDSKSFIIARDWDIKRIDANLKESDISFPRQIDNINLIQIKDLKLSFEFHEIGVDNTCISDYYIDLKDWTIKKHVA
jgi:hypothetical protein